MEADEFTDVVRIDEDGRRVITPVFTGKPKTKLASGSDPLPPSTLRVLAWLDQRDSSAS